MPCHAATPTFLSRVELCATCTLTHTVGSEVTKEFSVCTRTTGSIKACGRVLDRATESTTVASASIPAAAVRLLRTASTAAHVPVCATVTGHRQHEQAEVEKMGSGGKAEERERGGFSGGGWGGRYLLPGTWTGTRLCPDANSSLSVSIFKIASADSMKTCTAAWLVRFLATAPAVLCNSSRETLLCEKKQPSIWMCA